jgi:hypothetical protein
VEQLTQSELLHVEDLLKMEALAIRKYRLYKERCPDKEWISLFEEAEEIHRRHLAGLVNQLGQHDGREKKKHH